MIRVTALLPPELRDELELLSEALGLSMSQTLTRALRNYVNKNQKLMKAHKKVQALRSEK